MLVHPLSVTVLARMIGTGVRQLQRSILAETGLSPKEFYRLMRLRYARWILLNSDRRVTVIAYEYGFSDAAHFTRDFKAMYGLTPGQAHVHRCQRMYQRGMHGSNPERKLAFSLCGAVLPQVALAQFLASGAYDAHLRGIRRLFQDNLARMAAAVEASFPAETRMSRPGGGFVLWLELPRHFDSRALFDEALEHGICFAPGDVFSVSRRFRNCLRLSAGHAWNDRIEAGVHRLGRLAQALLIR